MIKYKTFTRVVGEPDIPSQVDAWLAEERPRTVLSHHEQTIGKGLGMLQVLTIFYKPRFKIERRHNHV